MFDSIVNKVQRAKDNVKDQIKDALPKESKTVYMQVDGIIALNRLAETNELRIIATHFALDMTPTFIVNVTVK